MGKTFRSDPDEDYGRPSKAERKRLKAERKARRKHDDELNEQMRPVDRDSEDNWN